MTHPKAISHESLPDSHQDVYSKTVFGFWIYLLTDFILFAALFATYSVLHKSTFGGPSARELVHLPFALLETLVLLTSSFTSGVAGALAHRKSKSGTVVFFLLTFLLGIAFMGMEWTEWTRLLSEGSHWKRSAFLSAFFTLVGTHALHMLFALLWVIVLIIPVCRYGITPVSLRRLICLKMFWQFLNIIWIFIFFIVYLMGGSLG